MTDFVPREPDLPNFPMLLCEWSPGFARSSAAAAVAQDLDLSTVVADAFGEYVLQLAATGERGAELDEALKAAEHMAISGDPEVQNCLVIALLSRLAESDDNARAIVPRLGPAATALYRRWVAPS